MMRYAANILVYLALTIWIGGLVVFGAVVAPALFGGTLPRTIAGAVNTTILNRLGMLEIVAGVVLVGGTLYGAIRVGSWMNWSALVLSIAMLATAAYYTNVLFPDVNRLRVEIGSFESIPTEKEPLKAQFDRGHRLYSTLAKGVLAAAIAVLVLQTVSLVRNGARREPQGRTRPERIGATMPAAETTPAVPERTRPTLSR
ncbi:MAG TPA: DUF4149 domain-containing protein [Candidatus Kapabacteria bacterium]|nr:DUF4149 domain-containing protein [Candidatus Kapabacteria bacterium]